MSQNLDKEIAKAKAECKARIARARAAQKRNDNRVKQVIVRLLEENHAELYGQLRVKAEHALSEQSRARAQKARERKERANAQGQGEQNAQQS